MKQSKMLEFIKQWKALERRQKELDYDRSRWCAEVRAEFQPGAVGDKQFSKWLEVELGVSIAQQEELRIRAAAFVIVPDYEQWQELGGSRQITKLIPLDKRERVAVIGQALTSKYRIQNIIKQRESKPVTPSQVPDVQVLAEYVEQLDGVPDEIREVARRHVRLKAMKAA